VAVGSADVAVVAVVGSVVGDLVFEIEGAAVVGRVVAGVVGLSLVVALGVLISEVPSGAVVTTAGGGGRTRR